jgi:hypothetical protein
MGYAVPTSGLASIGLAGVPVSPLYPVYGKFGNPCTVLGCISFYDVSEGALITTTLYGASRTYLCSSPGAVNYVNANRVIFRYD